MHRHGYKGKKFGRKTDQRSSLIQGLADSLIIHESIETTLTKAKAIRPYVEKLVTKAKIGDLHNRRQIISSLKTLQASNKLIDEIAPKLNARNSGYLRIVRTKTRVGDNAQLARISFVDELKTIDTKPTTKVDKTTTPKPKKVSEKTVVNKTKPATKSTTTKKQATKTTKKKEVKS